MRQQNAIDPCYWRSVWSRMARKWSDCSTDRNVDRLKTHTHESGRTRISSDFLRNKVQNRRKKTLQVRFSCKNGLKQQWTEHSCCTRSPLLAYTITEGLSARSGFARSGPIYCWCPQHIGIFHGIGICLSEFVYRICAPFPHTSFVCWCSVDVRRFVVRVDSTYPRIFLRFWWIRSSFTSIFV